MLQSVEKAGINWRRVCTSVVAHVLTVVFLGVIVVIVQQQGSLSAAYFMLDIVLVSVLACVCYITVLVEAMTSETFRYVRHAMSQDEAVAYMHTVRASVPQVRLVAEWSHVELVRNRHKRVVTHREERSFHFSRVVDSTGDLDEDLLEDGCITRVVHVLHSRLVEGSVMCSVV